MNDADTPLIVDRRHVALGFDEARPLVARVVCDAFGDGAEEEAPGVWRVALDDRGIVHDVRVALEDTAEGKTPIAVEVRAKRGPRAVAALVGSSFGAMVAWIALALTSLADMRGMQSPTRVIAWTTSIVMFVAMTSLLLHVARTRRVNATAAIEPTETFWRAAEQLEEMPRIGGGYRIAPNHRIDVADAEGEALAVEEAAIAEATPNASSVKKRP